jgi:hypothetical protein
MKVEFNNEEIKIINEVIENIKEKYGKETVKLDEFEIFNPLTPEWKTNFQHGCGYVWGCNGSRVHFENPCRSGGLIWLTRCKDTKAFYELVFHEVFEYLIDGGHERVIPEERNYIEEKFGVKLDKWAPLEDEMIRTLYPVDKKMLEESFKDCGEFSRTCGEIQERAKKLGV